MEHGPVVIVEMIDQGFMDQVQSPEGIASVTGTVTGIAVGGIAGKKINVRIEAAKVKGASGAKALLNGEAKTISKMSKSQLKSNLPQGWKYYENNGRVHIKDANGNFRVRIDPVDKVTNYQHMHIFDADGNPLDINGNIVGKKSPDGHMPWNK